tara:strand:- start:68 stop:361 length:294 start_codon:yes stop_codon:yes gene_type:complete
MSRGIKPTVIHRWGPGPTGHLCGAPKEHWGDKYASDAYAQSLPLCEKCAGFPAVGEAPRIQMPIDIPSKQMTTRERELMEARMRLRDMSRRLMEDDR